MEYAWYWLDDSGQWIEYGEEHPDHCSATVKSADLEKKFLADQKGVVFFRAGSQKYELSFEDMVQTNLVFETQRKVARLPKFLSSEGGQNRSQNMTLSCSVCPPQWDQSALPDVGYKLVQLSYTSSEYGKIKRLFEKTMKDYYIHQLQRIQNLALWQVFQWQKEQMKKLNKSKWVDERLLFHGTNPSHVSAICEQNFDWRICGTHGTMYGKGSYFARDASYSHMYCSPHGGRYSMFVAHVLVGDFVQGDPKYLRPPPRHSKSNRLYDSCVDDLTDPSIFVIFEKHQIYPAYIVEYSTGGQSPSRRGDLEILGYCMLQWLCGKLPWEQNLKDPVAVQSAKTKLMDELPDSVMEWDSSGSSCSEISKFLECVYGLAYDEKPKYGVLKKILLDGLESSGTHYDGPLEFSPAARARNHSAAKVPKKDTARELPPLDLKAIFSESKKKQDQLLTTDHPAPLQGCGSDITTPSISVIFRLAFTDETYHYSIAILVLLLLIALSLYFL